MDSVNNNEVMNEIVDIGYNTTFGDALAESRHDNIMATFHNLFYQWFQTPTNKLDYIKDFSETPDDVLCEVLDEPIIQALQQLPTEEQPAFALTYIAALELINRVLAIPNNIIKVNATVFVPEFWFNFRKTSIPEDVIQQFIPELQSIKTLSIMMSKFIGCYKELSIHPSWHMLYTFLAINLLSNYEKLSFKPNIKNIGGFTNITESV